MRPGFVRPDFAAPVDLAAQKKLVPPGATTKGMQLQALVDACKKRGAALAGRRYVAFRDYPGEELVDLLVVAAERAWPTVARREGMRRLGRVAYPTLRASLVGRVIFTAARADDVQTVWKLVPKGYAISANTGAATVLERNEAEAVVRLEGIYSFVDAWHVGILEGVVEAYDRTPDVLLRATSPTSADFWIRWRT